MLVKITCLVDNAAGHGSRLWGEHGVAFLIESKAGWLLFDTGQSGTVLLHNMEVLGIDPRRIDALAISHAHYDHTGGLPLLVEKTRPGLPLYAHPDLFRERFSTRSSSIGIPLTEQALAARTTLRLDEQPQEILPGIWTSGEIGLRQEPEGRSAHHMIKTADGWLPDPYRDDMSLVIEVAAGVVLLCGCCHAGLLNTLAHVERTFGRSVVIVAGGTHLLNASPAHLEQVGIRLRQSAQRVYLNHCSGEEASCALRLALGADVVRPCPAGTELELEV